MNQNIDIPTFDNLKLFIRDEINIVFKELHDKVKSEVTEVNKDLSHRLDDICNKHEKISIKLDELNDMVNKDKAYVDRINDLLTFQRKTQDNLNSHELRINTLQKNLKDACYKYDKIFLDNLIVPGVIGDFCKFKTLRDYIEVDND
jgi:chromosome segregation ATPase